jgi:hypothetical protein
MVQSKAGARSRSLVVKTYKELGIPLKYYSDDYSDDLPHWIPNPLAKQEESEEDQGLLIVPYASVFPYLSTSWRSGDER